MPFRNHCITFSAGNVTALLNFTIQNDTLVEGNEYIDFVINPFSNICDLPIKNLAEVKIVDDGK